MKSFLILLSIVSSSPLVYGEAELPCRAPPFRKEAEDILQVLGYTASCAASSLEMCSNNCSSGFKDITEEIKQQSKAAFEALTGMNEVLERLSRCLGVEGSLSEVTTKTLGMTHVHNCLDAKNQKFHESGIYTIYPFECCPDKSVKVYCDQATDGGGWTVFLNRDTTPVRENFDRNWTEYSNGFGNITEEFWLGLDVIHELSKNKTELRVHLEDEQGTAVHAKYSTFKVEDSSSNYKLTVGGYSGNSGDSFGKHSGMLFTTYDKDNDLYNGNCAVVYKGGWWSIKCHHTKLTGIPNVGKIPYAEGITWASFKGFTYSLPKAKMMIKPILN